MSKTEIQWTDMTWNPVTGCDRVSAGCDHCYALTLAKRLKAMGNLRYQVDGNPKTSGPGFGVTMHEDKITEPLTWRKPQRVFVNSMSDLFHADVPYDFLVRTFAVMATASQHTFQVLTKRPQRMRKFLADGSTPIMIAAMASNEYERPDEPLPWPLPNVWLGTSVENQEAAYRIDFLVQTPAAVRFLSCEPLIGLLDLSHWLPVPLAQNSPYFGIECDETHCSRAAAFTRAGQTVSTIFECRNHLPPTIDWVIAGGESGAGYRPVELNWLRGLRDQCVAAKVPYFLKQIGGRTPKAGGRELDGREWNEMPAVAS